MATVTFGSYLKWESLLHFMRTDPPRLDGVAPAIWAEAASVMLHLPDPAGEDFEAAVKLVARVAAEKPRAAEEALRGALKDTDNQGATFTRKLREAWNRRLTRIALDFIDGGQLATPVARDVLSSLLLHGHREARDYVFKSLKRGLDGPDPQRRVAIDRRRPS